MPPLLQTYHTSQTSIDTNQKYVEKTHEVFESTSMDWIHRQTHVTIRQNKQKVRPKLKHVYFQFVFLEFAV